MVLVLFVQCLNDYAYWAVKDIRMVVVAEFHEMMVKIRKDWLWFLGHIFFCVTQIRVIIGFLDSTLNSLQFGYKFCMFRIRNGFKKRI
jgi:hypothetical protein